MSTLPFLLSVADELDNINSQSYMDDFGLGFHPHRQFYRTPTIQLSLPASTEWMQQERQQRYRVHKFVDETQNNFEESTGETGDNDEETDAADEASRHNRNLDKYEMHKGDRYASRSSSRDGDSASGGACENRQKYASAFNSNESTERSSRRGGERRDRNADDSDNIDNSVQMYNLSKKCCKNYYRHTGKNKSMDSASCSANSGTGATSSGGGGNSGLGVFKLHTKCLEGNNSSSDESLQKVSSSIEFLTCFLLKKSRTSSNNSSSSAATTSKQPTSASATTSTSASGNAESGGKKS